MESVVESRRSRDDQLVLFEERVNAKFRRDEPRIVLENGNISFFVDRESTDGKRTVAKIEAGL